ncbi:MAG: ribbon-helix-helix domain-containing protein [Planctomycetes bacterium]|nr:ribbon-helix-helix domain-containing protein [Planctomycetota bacterium]
MVRTQVYLTEEEHQGLKALSSHTGKKQSELIRSAIDKLIAENSPQQRLAFLRGARSMWKKRKDLPDFPALREEANKRARRSGGIE